MENPSLLQSQYSADAFQHRQRLLQQIYKFNTNVDTPAYFRIHVTGLTVEEEAIVERGSSIAGEEGNRSVPPKPQTGQSEERYSDHEVSTIEPRNLKREKATLEMEGRRQAAKEQFDARFEEQYKIDSTKKKVEPSASQEVLTAGSRETHEATAMAPKPPPRGLIPLVEAREKANKDWLHREKYRKLLAEDDESRRKNLLDGITRAVAAIEDVGTKVIRVGLDIMIGDQEMPETEKYEEPGVSKLQNNDQNLATPRKHTVLPRSIAQATRQEENKRPQLEDKESSSMPIQRPILPARPGLQPQPQPQQKPRRSPLPNAWDDPLLPGELPYQWKIRMLAREAEQAAKDKLKSEAEAAVKKGKRVRVVNKDGDGNLVIEEVERIVPSAKDEEIEAEQFRKLEERRERRDGVYKCYATRSKIERDNAEARERAKALETEIEADADSMKIGLGKHDPTNKDIGSHELCL